NTWRTLAFSGRPSLISCSSIAVNSARSVMVRPSFATNTASGAYKAIIASIFPELNRLSRDGITPSASVGRGKLSDIRISCSCWLSCHAAMMRIVVVMIVTLDELFQWPMRIVFITTENGAMPVVNPFASQRELHGPLQRRGALQAAITIVHRLYGER